jgi:4'-phosphopantetheinyl transferase
VIEESRWWPLLDGAEQLRADAYRVSGARRTFVASRAAQRIVAARYLDRDPASIRIRRTCEHCGDPGHGRPALVDAGTLDYSVSHSGDWLIIAVVGAGRVGADLERCRSIENVDELARGVLTADEAAELRALPPNRRIGWFYSIWTRKEAVVKLTGHGLGTALSGVDVRGPLATIVRRPAGFPPDPVHLRDLRAPPDYVAAIAHTGEIAAIRPCRLR